ncbi:YndM family protein [Halobacillus shinanisalinarum]|uniref:YndM family protein n=1 Tax=Halobacillus shinanisalinarum TaxID=2932258 RepID=A0ABY4H1K1_9BACI|nr:DUF2512 family protein [Halobacillus shinanisalinarum]UOQ94316.1 YndM family protein [Halobacillus shinanisalinarum]
MTSLLVKIVTLPIVLILAMYFLESVNYGSIWQPIMVAIVLTAIGIVMEYMLLKDEGSLWKSTILDFITSFIIIWGFSNIFAGAEVTFVGALLTSLVIGISEYLLHKHLISTRKAVKSPA